MKPAHKTPPHPMTPAVRTKIYVGDDMIGSGKIDLLRAIATKGSFNGAIRSMGLGRHRARFLLQTLEACFAQPLVTRGPKGSTLTPLGLDLIDRYDRHLHDVDAASRPFLAWLETHQARDPDH